MVRTTNVRKFKREYAPGKFTDVRKHTREIPDAQFDPLPADVVEKINTAHLLTTSPDANQISRVTFLKGNELWAQKPDKYDVLGYDASNVPQYDKIPERALPNQIIKIKRGDRMSFYVGDKTGHFKRTMPPSYKNKVLLQKQERKELSQKVEALKHEHDPNLIPANEGWKVKQTKSYLEMGPEGQVSGAFPFYTDGKTYVTWPATKAAKEHYKKDMEKDKRAEQKLQERLRNKEAEEREIKNRIEQIKSKKERFPESSSFQKELDKDIEGWEKQLEKTKNEKEQRVKTAREIEKKIVELQTKHEKQMDNSDLKGAKETTGEINALYRRAEKDDLNLYTANP